MRFVWLRILFSFPIYDEFHLACTYQWNAFMVFTRDISMHYRWFGLFLSIASYFCNSTILRSYSGIKSAREF